MSDENTQWERKLLEKLASEALVEQRRKRRWGIFFKLIGFAYIGIVIASLMGLINGPSLEVSRHTALVDLEGVIASDTMASADRINSGLRSAFESESSAGVILRINSPGGSPVQAGLINDEIKRLRAKYPNKPFYAVVEEVCASGGYYVAAAADKIYVDKASLVGSIGVVMNGFGFTGTMEKLGVERRLITSGDNKGFLDPFSEADPYQTEFAKQMAEEIHQQFIKVVKDGRGDKLASNPELFSGLVWTGERSVELGLADALGSIDTVARDVIKAENILDYSEQDSFAERFAERVGVVFGQGVRSVFPEFGASQRLGFQ
ncbi:S49 family peptidase [Limnobacter parvus]|uniref:S49 family peptidase n=1 Tax=Limnobacter parvus TaxID=2939690 RepID=A0ABT1XHZ0_9BURK|nr:S49 family peptidase [Limnobacter parvus]MCR2746900.1 S49 family peptidase [Limnobacter parvus]